MGYKRQKINEKFEALPNHDRSFTMNISDSGCLLSIDTPRRQCELEGKGKAKSAFFESTNSKLAPSGHINHGNLFGIKTFLAALKTCKSQPWPRYCPQVLQSTNDGIHLNIAEQLHLSEVHEPACISKYFITAAISVTCIKLRM
ncbi:T-cell ecto-ADP-ribosyltransferase 2, partial [Striga asiatica]